MTIIEIILSVAVFAVFVMQELRARDLRDELKKQDYSIGRLRKHLGVLDSNANKLEIKVHELKEQSVLHHKAHISSGSLTE